MKWEVIERQTQGLGLSCQQHPGDAVKSLIACAEDALSFVVGGSGPARRERVTDSLRGTVENAKRLLGG